MFKFGWHFFSVFLVYKDKAVHIATNESKSITTEQVSVVRK